ncbi:MAG TPA: transcriptional regulator [Alphaproteobacteria bacterium]|nr:transcriptional regulator [Alphaproteobacteria bacterium]HAJ46752.1 transcriptional regulator [Alphaproteobacteria bacterium]
MDILDFLVPQAVFTKVKGGAKRTLLEALCQKAAPFARLPEAGLFEAVWEREMLNSMGVGQGIAIPHGRIKHLDRMVGLFARLESPVDYEAIDGLPVDLVFLLLSPEAAGADHLKALAKISRLLRNQKVCEKLRASSDSAALYSILTEPAANAQAA